MKLTVRTENAAKLGNGLVTHIRKVQAFRAKHGKYPSQPYLTYTQLVEQTGAKLALVGIGNFLDELMAAIHGPDAPEAMRGLTLFVTPKGGHIDFSNSDLWYGIEPANAPAYRRAVLEFDWSDVQFQVQGEG